MKISSVRGCGLSFLNHTWLGKTRSAGRISLLMPPQAASQTFNILCTAFYMGLDMGELDRVEMLHLPSRSLSCRVVVNAEQWRSKAVRGSGSVCMRPSAPRQSHGVSDRKSEIEKYSDDDDMTLTL